jgi:hypothetical protein
VKVSLEFYTTIVALWAEKDLSKDRIPLPPHNNFEHETKRKMPNSKAQIKMVTRG